MKNYQITVSSWIEQIGKENNIKLILDEDGHCVIPFAKDLFCIVEVPDDDEASAVFIYLPIIELPTQASAQLTLIKKALQLNLFGLVTGGCHLAFDPRSNRLVLSFSAQIDALNEAMFSNVVNDMSEIAPGLIERLNMSNANAKATEQEGRASAAYLRQVNLKRFQMSDNPESQPQ